MRSLKQLIKGLCPVSPAEEKRFVPRVLDIYRRSVQYPIFLINFPQVSWGSSGIDSSSVNEVMNLTAQIVLNLMESLDGIILADQKPAPITIRDHLGLGTFRSYLEPRELQSKESMS